LNLEASYSLSFLWDEIKILEKRQNFLKSCEVPRNNIVRKMHHNQRKIEFSTKLRIKHRSLTGQRLAGWKYTLKSLKEMFWSLNLDFSLL